MVDTLAATGSHPLGFRVTGTPEERRVADAVAGWMRDAGLEDVGIERVPVDAWRFLGASVTPAGGPPIEAASLGGAPPTRRAGVEGPLVYVEDGRRTVLDRRDLTGRVAVVDWRAESRPISDIGVELGLRGCEAMIVASLPGGARFQGDGALGTSVVGWHPEAPPVVTVREHDALHLIQRCDGASARVELDVQIRAADGRNVAGILPGRRSTAAPLVVGAHHDGWFRGAFDNASGVACMLAVARAARDLGWRPARPVWFVSHTAEEYGRTQDDYSWCLGAWHQVTRAHPRWGASVPFYLNVEASGHPGLPLRVEGPVELRRLAARVVGAADRAGRLPRGWVFGPPVTGTEAWQFELRGVPSISVYNWHREFARTDYHTTRDTQALLDYGLMADLARLYLELLTAAEAAGDRLLDHAARARDLRRSARRWAAGPELTGAAEGYARDGSRRAFVRLARRGFAVDAHGAVGYLPEQAAHDVRCLDRALDRLQRGDRRGAAAWAVKVGENRRTAVLTPAARSVVRRRPRPGSWAAHAHLTRSPDLAAEIAALRGDRSARPFGGWVEHSLRRARDRQARELARRTDRLLAALSAQSRPRSRS